MTLIVAVICRRPPPNERTALTFSAVRAVTCRAPDGSVAAATSPPPRQPTTGLRNTVLNKTAHALHAEYSHPYVSSIRPTRIPAINVSIPDPTVVRSCVQFRPRQPKCTPDKGERSLQLSFRLATPAAIRRYQYSISPATTGSPLAIGPKTRNRKMAAAEVYKQKYDGGRLLSRRDIQSSL